MNSTKVISIDSSRPAKNSPVGQLMAKILEKSPEMSFEDTRAEANRLLSIAAGRWDFRIPRVHTTEEKAAFRERMQHASRKSKAAA